MRPVTLRESPRDAFQGISTFIPTQKKIHYLKTLLEVGFEEVDCVSFVSAKAIPQLKDSAEVLDGLASSLGKNRLLAIVANLRGAEQACRYHVLEALGYPLSLSETFQQRNTHRSIVEAFHDLGNIYTCAQDAQKDLVVFLSMGFGNPYGDAYKEDILLRMLDRLERLGVLRISIADTVGIASPRHIEDVFSSLCRHFPDLLLGVHLHALASQAKEKLTAAYQAGCRHFDVALHGYGGCPMAADQLTGNISTQVLISYLESQGERLSLDLEALDRASTEARELFTPMYRVD